MRMPTDGFAFKDIEDRWPIFKEEPHNLKLSLAIDDVNPFGEMRSIYSTWPFFLLTITFLLGCP